jgi:hypothetical protein
MWRRALRQTQFSLEHGVRHLVRQSVRQATRLLAVTAAVALMGCGTSYREMDQGRGVQALRMSADTWRIEARGNAYTNANLVKDYMLLKAAETTKQQGGSHFIIVEQADASTKSSSITPGARQTTLVGATRYSTYTPATISRQMLPGQDAYIRVITVSGGQDVPPEAKSADEIIKYIGGRIPRG